jgi:hypothetical protein
MARALSTALAAPATRFLPLGASGPPQSVLSMLFSGCNWL